MSTQPAPVVELDEHRFDLGERVRAFLADQVLDDLSDDDLIELFIDSLSPLEARVALSHILARYFGDVRRKSFHTAAKSRWSGIDHQKVEALRERIFSEWVITEEGRKRFGACTAADVQYLADERHRQSERNLAWADKFTKVNKAMRRAKAATVADLGDEAVRLIANA